jgi:hypothetical protein
MTCWCKVRFGKVLVNSSSHVPGYVISCHVDKLFRREFPKIESRFVETRTPTVSLGLKILMTPTLILNRIVWTFSKGKFSYGQYLSIYVFILCLLQITRGDIEWWGKNFLRPWFWNCLLGLTRLRCADINVIVEQSWNVQRKQKRHQWNQCWRRSLYAIHENVALKRFYVLV